MVRALVDTRSILADLKEVLRQLRLLAEDAALHRNSAGQGTSMLPGRKQIGGAFGARLTTFEKVHHINGKHAVTVQGDRARGTSSRRAAPEQQQR